MEQPNELLRYIFYPVTVGTVVAIISVVVKYIGNYFNKLNNTLVTLNATINSLRLEQTELHLSQDKTIAQVQHDVCVEKKLRMQHGEDIDELFGIVTKHGTEIEVIKTKIT